LKIPSQHPPKESENPSLSWGSRYLSRDLNLIPTVTNKKQGALPLRRGVLFPATHFVHPNYHVQTHDIEEALSSSPHCFEDLSSDGFLFFKNKYTD
jgi:hypothetical protein